MVERPYRVRVSLSRIVKPMILVLESDNLVFIIGLMEEVRT